MPGFGIMAGAAVNGYRQGESDKEARKRTSIAEAENERQQAAFDERQQGIKAIEDQIIKSSASTSRLLFTQGISKYIDSLKLDNDNNTSKIPDINQFNKLIQSDEGLSKTFGRVNLLSPNDPVDVNHIKKIIADQALNSNEEPNSTNSGTPQVAYSKIKDETVQKIMKSGEYVKLGNGDIVSIEQLVGMTDTADFLPSKDMSHLQATMKYNQMLAQSERVFKPEEPKEPSIAERALQYAEAHDLDLENPDDIKKMGRYTASLKGNKVEGEPKDESMKPMNDFINSIGANKDDYIPTEADIEKAAEIQDKKLTVKYKDEIKDMGLLVGVYKDLVDFDDEELVKGTISTDIIKRVSTFLHKHAPDSLVEGLLTDEQIHDMVEQTGFDARLGGIFSKYMKSTTGMAAPNAEFRRLLKNVAGGTINNTESFKAAFRRFTKSVKSDALTMSKANLYGIPFQSLQTRKDIYDYSDKHMFDKAFRKVANSKTAKDNNWTDEQIGSAAQDLLDKLQKSK